MKKRKKKSQTLWVYQYVQKKKRLRNLFPRENWAFQTKSIELPIFFNPSQCQAHVGCKNHRLKSIIHIIITKFWLPPSNTWFLVCRVSVNHFPFNFPARNHFIFWLENCLNVCETYNVGICLPCFRRYCLTCCDKIKFCSDILLWIFRLTNSLTRDWWYQCVRCLILFKFRKCKQYCLPKVFTKGTKNNSSSVNYFENIECIQQ